MNEKLWCIDSGCTTHMCGDISEFSNLSEVNSSVKLADNSVTQVRAKGDVQIQTNENACDSVTLKNTLFVPELGTNLISVAKIVDNGHDITFNRNCAVIKNSAGETKVIGDRIGDLFFLRGTNAKACAATEIKPADSQMQKWHVRLGHLNANDLTRMLKINEVSGINFNDPVDLSKCNTCLAGKITNTPFAKRETKSSKLLEIVHTDVCVHDEDHVHRGR